MNITTRNTHFISERNIYEKKSVFTYRNNHSNNHIFIIDLAVNPPTPSNHRLRRGLPGYLILFAPHAFEPQRQ